MQNILETDEKDFARFAGNIENKQLPKPSLLYVFTGLGRYSWYRIPFVKGIYCVSIPAYLISRLWVLLKFQRGKCHCKGTTCFYIRILGLTIGLCEKGKAKIKRLSD